MPRVLFVPEAMLHTPGAHIETLEAAGFEVRYPKNPQLARGLCDEEESFDEMRDYDAVIAGSEHYTAQLLERLPKLRVIARSGVGYDRVDVEAATAKNIVLTITPTANHAAVAEHALALLFAICKNIVVGDRLTRAGQWPRTFLEPVRGKTLGILGLGRIGRSMATRSAALGMKVIAHDACPDTQFAQRNGIELVDFQSLIQRCDVLSIHCPNNAATKGLINRDVFGKMKTSAILINTARGSIVHEADLIEALRAGAIKAAGLDVYEQEPPAKDNPLFQMDCVVLAPHSAGADALAMRDMACEAADCVVQLYQGQWPEAAIVNNSLHPRWHW